MLLIILALGILTVALGTTAIVVSVTGWLAPPSIVYQLPNSVEPKVVYPGDPITITLKRCAADGINGQVYYTVSSTLVEQSGQVARRQLLPNSHIIPEGCTTTQATFKQVPPDLDPGVWHIESAIVAYGAHGPKLLYSVTEWFTVMPADVPLP
jgi:hypothetical protein